MYRMFYDHIDPEPIAQDFTNHNFPSGSLIPRNFLIESIYHRKIRSNRRATLKLKRETLLNQVEAKKSKTATIYSLFTNFYFELIWNLVLTRKYCVRIVRSHAYLWNCTKKNKKNYFTNCI